jgi:hypothetical protein
VTGTATLSVGIKIFFFSFSVSVTASKTFGGGSDASGGDIRGRLPQRGTYTGDTPPTVATQMDQTDWNNYCAAFA